MAKPKPPTDLPAVFTALRSIFAKWENKLAIEHDTSTYYTLVGKKVGETGSHSGSAASVSASSTSAIT